MKSQTICAVGLIGIVPAAAALLAGCGSKSKVVPHPAASQTQGPQTLTILIPEMGERLKLM